MFFYMENNLYKDEDTLVFAFSPSSCFLSYLTETTVVSNRIR